ncbi:beta-glucosidase [Methylacidimicrobium cyclopophantes]|uniref:beta-glucosidase n=1 Tax=Methylacidimicrobium cyclopophantes TaxID=1041766 RepID=A0A5E6M786_9BACT|nr:glycoside hydrolase family 3 N-terminal domain-containing protein [Methylacidimicrobium cyclopophantes]VVM05399.1 beta-glucosidase [Methylacidimicrobium cyclopophantes]
MTIEEKVGQLVQMGAASGADPLSAPVKKAIREGRVGSFLNWRDPAAMVEAQRLAREESRLGIPLLFAFDIVHGFRTVFPIPLALAASWNPRLVEEVAALSAREGRSANIHWTFAPMLDICRDPRWGRIAESPGEDPFLASVLATAWVKGFQGDDLSSPERLAACAKHFVAYGAVEGGRDYAAVDLSLGKLLEVSLPPFQAAVRANAASVMSAFVSVNGLPVAANPFLLQTLLRRRLGFRGPVISDWNAVAELLPHGVASTSSEAVRIAMEAGVDIDMASGLYAAELPGLVRRGEIPEPLLDRAVERVLDFKTRLGLWNVAAKAPTPEGASLPSGSRRLALQAAREAIVLLKNRGSLLPLSSRIHSIAVIGPLADDRKNALGPWSGVGRPEDVVSILEGVRNRAPAGTRLLFARGSTITGGSKAGFAEAVAAAKAADLVLVVVGEEARMSGEAASRSDLGLPGRQEELVRTLCESGKPVVAILCSGRPLAIPWIADHVPALLVAWFLGVESGNAIADILFGLADPVGRLPVTIPRAVGQVPIYYSHANTGRPPGSGRDVSGYIDLPESPLFPFGHGLAYTRFTYRDIRVSPERVGPGQSIEASVLLENEGLRAAVETVQLYLRDLAASITRPVAELKGFQRVSLRPGQKCRVYFSLPSDALAFLGPDGEPRRETGDFELRIGPSSAAGLSARFRFDDTPRVRTSPPTSP